MTFKEFRSSIRKKIVSSYHINEEMDNYNYPPGADHSGAPWNKKPLPEIKRYTINYDKGIFTVEMTNGQEYEIDFLSVLEEFWKKKNNAGSFEKHHQMFGDDELSMEKNTIQYLRDKEHYEFSDILSDLVEDKLV